MLDGGLLRLAQQAKIVMHNANRGTSRLIKERFGHTPAEEVTLGTRTENF